MEFCIWKYDEAYDVWEADCGLRWQLEYTTPIENEMYYCPKCGKLLRDAPKEAEEHDEV